MSEVLNNVSLKDSITKDDEAKELGDGVIQRPSPSSCKCSKTRNLLVYKGSIMYSNKQKVVGSKSNAKKVEYNFYFKK